MKLNIAEEVEQDNITNLPKFKEEAIEKIIDIVKPAFCLC